MAAQVVQNPTPVSGPNPNGVVSLNQSPNPNGNGGTNGGNGGAAFVTTLLYVATDSNGQSMGFGFFQFDTKEAAQKAIEKLNGMLINDKQVYVGHFFCKQERDTNTSRTKFNNVFVKNLSESIADEDLKKVFGEFGPITSAVVMRDADGESRCFGFVNFDNADDAANAVEALNGKKFDDEECMKEAADKYQGANLYVKNLDDTIDDEKPKELFAEYGKITSCKVMHDPSGISKGSGFVAFSSPDEASRAAQFSEMRPMAMTPPAGPRMPIYPPGAAGMGQQIFYGQAPPMIPPQVKTLRFLN
ncbi:Polyadenylate-binding protein 2 [Bienertia sinuspersici]